MQKWEGGGQGTEGQWKGGREVASNGMIGTCSHGVVAYSHVCIPLPLSA